MGSGARLKRWTVPLPGMSEHVRHDLGSVTQGMRLLQDERPLRVTLQDDIAALKVLSDDARLGVQGNRGHLHLAGDLARVDIGSNDGHVLFAGAGLEVRVRGNTGQAVIVGDRATVRVEGSDGLLLICGDAAKVVVMRSSHLLFIHGDECEVEDHGVGVAASTATSPRCVGARPSSRGDQRRWHARRASVREVGGAFKQVCRGPRVVVEVWVELLAQQATWTTERAASLRLSPEDALVLVRDAPFHELRHAAALRRQAMLPGREVTYLIDRNVNYTNVCTINCQFCSFYRPPGHAETYLLSLDEISAKLAELEAIGGRRVLMQGGVHPGLGLAWYLELIAALHARHPSIDLDCFSPIEIDGIAEMSELTTLDVLSALRDAGMHGLPGGGAEMLVDAVREEVSPKKHPRAVWMRIMREAQDLGLTTSATNVFGFGEPLEARIEHMCFVREHQDAALTSHGNGFTSFIAWPVQLEHNNYGRRRGGRNRIELGAGPVEYLRHVAIARLVLDNVAHIQASWPTMGIETAEQALLGGADDIGSTMMEENVVSASGTGRTSVAEHDLQTAIIRSGHEPRRRASTYDLLDTPRLVTAAADLAAPPALAISS